jgi:transmembrane sensor
MTIQELFDKYYDKMATGPERQELMRKLSTADDKVLFELVTKAGKRLQHYDQQLTRGKAKAMVNEILGKTVDLQSADASTRVHRIYFLKTSWFRYAAAILISVGVGSFVYIINQKEKPSVTTINPLPLKNDVAPGGNKAVLTLADGTTIMLDSAANGKIANEDQATVIKTADGRIEYKATGQKPNAVAYNTMMTPRGGQFQLQLPDGSQAWLNAASSITYPTSFNGKTREVSISGEVYFEITKNRRQPFIVRAGKQTIEVLGTHFNINIYTDETSQNTTLLEGSVRIKSVHTSLTLKPGQQGRLDPRTNNLSLAANPDIEQVIAWKNGAFNFNRLSLKAVLQQLARWYDVEVVYEEKMPEMTFRGEMGRDLNLSQVLKALNTLGVKFEIEGNRLKVKS